MDNQELKQIQKELLQQLSSEGIKCSGDIIFQVAESGYTYDEKKYRELLEFSIARADESRENRYIAEIGLLINTMNY